MPRTRLTSQYCKRNKTREQMAREWEPFRFLVDVQIRKCHTNIPELADKMQRSSDRVRVWLCEPGEFRAKDLANMIYELGFTEEEWQELIRILFAKLIKEAKTND